MVRSPPFGLIVWTTSRHGTARSLAVSESKMAPSQAQKSTRKNRARSRDRKMKGTLYEVVELELVCKIGNVIQVEN
jgi:hypothetical protein